MAAIIAAQTNLHTGCKCAECVRKAELLDVLEALQADAARHREERRGMLATVERYKQNALNQAAKADRWRKIAIESNALTTYAGLFACAVCFVSGIAVRIWMEGR